MTKTFSFDLEDNYAKKFMKLKETSHISFIEWIRIWIDKEPIKK